MNADILTLLGSDPAAGILAAADLREQRAKAATPGPYVVSDVTVRTDEVDIARVLFAPADAVHIAAEANPAHALAAVHRWRGVVERHTRADRLDPALCVCRLGDGGPGGRWPCIDIRETADEARAYVSGGSQ